MELGDANISVKLTEIISNLVSVTPNTNFLSDIITFESAVIAIAIPLSIEIVSRISERYESGIITEKFQQEWIVKCLPKLLIFNIVFIVFLKFFDNYNLSIEKIFLWIALLLFITISVIFVSFFAKLRLYIAAPKNLLSLFFKETEDLLKQIRSTKLKDKRNLKTLSAQQTSLIDALEGIGDILTFQAKNKKGNKEVIEGLEVIENIIEQFLEIKTSEPDKFERLLFSQEFFENYQRNKNEASFILSFAGEKALISFSTAINQFLRICESASEAKNFEISQSAVYPLTSLLSSLSQTPGNELLIEQIISNLYQVKKLAINHTNTSLCLVSIRWYVWIVFNKKTFDLYYLEIYDRAFFRSIQDIIDQNQTTVFKYLIQQLVDGIQISTYFKSIWTYYELISKLNHRANINETLAYKYQSTEIKKLESLRENLFAKEQLEIWFKEFDNFKGILNHIFKCSPSEEAETLEHEIKSETISLFKLNHLLEMVFYIGAYCLFKKRYDYIKYIWQVKQPPDSDATWVGHDIAPVSIIGLVNLYSRLDKDFSIFWDGHHGSKIYLQKYFLLSMTYLFYLNWQDKDKILSGFKLPNNLKKYQLDNLVYSVDRLITVANNLKKELKQEIDILNEFNFDVNQIEDIFENGIINLLNQIKNPSQTQTQKYLSNSPKNKLPSNQFTSRISISCQFSKLAQYITNLLISIISF